MKNLRLLRALYVLIFLIALLAVFAGWPMVGGQVHLDYVGWEWKLAGAVAFAGAAARCTRAMVEADQAWNAASVGWLLAMLLAVAGMGLITYRAHLQELEENQDAETFRGALHSPTRLERRVSMKA